MGWQKTLYKPQNRHTYSSINGDFVYIAYFKKYFNKKSLIYGIPIHFHKMVLKWMVFIWSIVTKEELFWMCSSTLISSLVSHSIWIHEWKFVLLKIRAIFLKQHSKISSIANN